MSPDSGCGEASDMFWYKGKRLWKLPNICTGKITAQTRGIGMGCNQHRSTYGLAYIKLAF